MFKILFFIIFLSNIHNNNNEEKNILEINILISKANKLNNTSDFAKSISVYEKAIEKSQIINYEEGLASAYIGAASVSNLIAASNKTINYLFSAEKYANNDPIILCQVNAVKGLIFHRAHSYDEAIKKYKLSIKYAEKIKDPKESERFIYKANINICNVYVILEKYDLAIEHAYKGFSSKNLINKLGNAINMSEIFIMTNKIDSAQKYLNFVDQNLFITNNDPFKLYYIESTKSLKSLLYIKKGNYTEALKQLNKNSTNTTHYQVEELLGIAYSKLGKPESALYNFQKISDDKLNSKLLYVNNYNASSIILNDEKQAKEDNLKRQRKYLIIIFSALSIIFFLFIIYYKQKINKQRVILLESEKEKLEMEEEISKLKEEHFQKQILATSIQLEHKTNVFNELKDNLLKDKDFNFKRIFKSEKLVNNDLNEIQNIVKEVHPIFYKKLHEVSKVKLTNLDIKYASYIYMNMNNSEISSVLKADNKTVSVHKYRLKQKLGIDKNIDLATFLKSLK